MNEYKIAAIRRLVADKLAALKAEVENAAARIVDGAMEPGSAYFQNAVKDHRAAKADAEYYSAVAKRLTDIETQQQ